jgi:chromate transporter
MTGVLISLAIIFAQLSLMAFGGGNAILPEMQRQVVDVHHWMTALDFSALFGLSQAAPGPNLMIVTLIGWHVAGAPGALVVSLAKFGPSSLLTATVLYVWKRFKDSPWRRIIQTGLAPMTVGLVAASAAIITQASVHEWTLGALAAFCMFAMLDKRLHPLSIIAIGALVGLSGIGQA